MNHTAALIVEDDLSLVEWFQTVAEELNPDIDIYYAAGASEALEKIEIRAQRGHHPPFDLVLTDIFLNDPTTGLGLWSECQKQFPEMPVVVTSSFPIEDYLTILCGFNERPRYLKQPFSTAAFKQVIEQYL